MVYKILKLLSQPIIIWYLFIDKFCVHLYLRMQGVEVGKNCTFLGFPLIKKLDSAKIIIGNGVTITSRTFNNPIGLPHKTILASIGKKSVLIIGDNTGISGASIVAKEYISIGENVNIGGGVGIWDTDFHPINPVHRKTSPNDSNNKRVVIEDDVFIGARAIILKGVVLGKASVIAAASIVTKSVEPYCIVGGNPAIKLKDVER